VPARRRRSLSRSSTERTRLWNAKVKGDIYAQQLLAVKDMALEKVAGYQATHEYLISIVKLATSKFGAEGQLVQEYMWYAEKLWKLIQTYKSNALQKEADALYLWYLARGRSDLALRAVANALGIKISSLEDIAESTLTPALIKVVKKDTIVTDGSEQTLLEYIGNISTIAGYIDMSNMSADDTVIVRSYVKIKEGGEYVLYHPETFIGEQTEPALYTLPRLSGFAFKITIQQTGGTFKNFDYLFVKGV
jgi:hypothetical protein